MKLQEGVDLHFIPTEQFTTNQIKIRFAAPMDKESVAARVLAANILEIGNQLYPNHLAFRRQLARMYGATFSTSVSRKGAIHLVDLTMTYVREELLLEKENLTEQVLDFMETVLMKPLTDKAGFKGDVFEVEKKNLLSYLEAEVEDNFYHADLELNQLFFENEHLQISRVGNIELVKEVTAESAYKAFQSMLQLDKIDIFVLGSVNQDRLVERLKQFPFSYRNPELSYEYQEAPSAILREKTEKKDAKQSILELGYALHVLYNDVNYPALLVLNGMFGGFAHSGLFTQIREEEGLAYTIGSQVNIFTGFMRVYAGIDRGNRLKVMRAIHRELLKIKQGRVTEKDLGLTKNMLIHSALIGQDRGKNLVEQAYHRQIFGERYMTVTSFMEKIKAVTLEDVVRVAQLIRLQAVYFMEGVE